MMSQISGTAADISAFGYMQELKRSLGPFDLLAYGLVFIVPIAPVAVPAIGFAIIAYVLWNAEANAKLAGGFWLAGGFILFPALRLLRRPTRLPRDVE